MPINQFLPFAIDEDANVMSQADYAGLLARQSGFQMGVASSQQLNKVWRQASIISTAIAQFICDNQAEDVLDNGEIPTLVTQLETAIQSFLGGNSTLVLPGTTVLWCAPVVPAGYLELAGQAISRTTYSTLFVLFGTTYGSGNGSTTFNLPDLRGEFVRGWDHGRGVDSGRTFGSNQSDELRSHAHDILTNDNELGIGRVTVGGEPTSTTYQTESTGGNETRPRNIALMYIIKT